MTCCFAWCPAVSSFGFSRQSVIADVSIVANVSIVVNVVVTFEFSRRVSADCWTCSLQTVAEKKAWELSKKEGFELATIMPSLVLGPVTGTRPDGTSINAMKVICQCSLIVYSRLGSVKMQHQAC